jgi:FkbM family methyltransferase
MASSKPMLPFLFRWYVRGEFPGWGRLYQHFGMGGIDNINPRWRNAPTLTTRGKFHRYKMRLDLSRDLDRATYFLGRYYDLPIQLLLNTILHEGDLFIDGGANTGMMTLHAARLVGPTGRVISFEPIPENCRRIGAAIGDNDIGHVTVVNKALGEKDETLCLHILGGDTIMATLRTNQRKPLEQRETIEVPVARGDDECRPYLSTARVVLKLDLEGWEHFALRGFDETIEHHRPIILLEIEPRYLRDAGVDEDELHRWMIERDYKPFVIGLQRSLLKKPRLRLASYETAQDLIDLNDFANPSLAEMRNSLGHQAEYVDVIWLPGERNNAEIAEHTVPWSRTG